MQLRLWGNTRVDLHAKLLAEKVAGVEVFYHFCGQPIFMTSRPAGKPKE